MHQFLTIIPSESQFVANKQYVDFVKVKSLICAITWILLRAGKQNPEKIYVDGDILWTYFLTDITVHETLSQTAEHQTKGGVYQTDTAL